MESIANHLPARHRPTPSKSPAVRLATNLPVHPLSGSLSYGQVFFDPSGKVFAVTSESEAEQQKEGDGQGAGDDHQVAGDDGGQGEWDDNFVDTHTDASHPA